MGFSFEIPSPWDEIERSESYLVCCMFGEAESLASSVLKSLCDTKLTQAIIEDVEFNDMLESAGMVLVQSLKELGRTSEILKGLKLLFGSLSAVPVQVFLTGVCFQMQEDPSCVQEFLEEFLSSWRCVDGRYYVLASAKANLAYTEGCNNRFVLGVDKYLEVVEVYVVTLLTVVLSDMDLAFSWVEKAPLPEEKRQELLRRLHSIYSSKVTSSSQTDENRTHSASLKESNMYEGSSKLLEAQNPSDGEKNAAKQAILKLSGQRVPRYWWARTINLKIGNNRLVISNGSVLLSCLMFLACYFIRRKRATVKRVLRRHALTIKKAVVDLWQLAFSYQVNPLAAVQPLPSATR